MFWLSKQPQWRMHHPSRAAIYSTDIFTTGQARIIDVSTRDFGLNSPAVAITGDDDDDDHSDGRKLCYLPSFSRTYSIWYKGHYISVTRSQSQDGIYRMKEVLQIEYVPS